MTVKQLPVKIDENTGEPVIDPDTGKQEFESAVRVLPREPRRFKPFTTLSFFGNSYVLGATDPAFIRSIWDTVIFAVITVFLELVLGIIVALIIDVNFPGQGLMRAIILVPWAIPTAVSSQMWAFMLQPNRTGFFNTLFWRLGIGDGEIPFLTSPASTTAIHDRD